ncbi:MAG: hypothetical protein JNM85_02500 [Chthonomonas sp.]|nr:hypothetical protein [Chthonomonas sp.]
MISYKLEEIEKTALPLVGTLCEISWNSTNRMAKRQCEKCVYVVRGLEGPMLCVELLYDAIDGEHRKDHIYWVPADAVQALRVLTPSKAQYRIETLEREALEDQPRG